MLDFYSNSQLSTLSPHLRIYQRFQPYVILLEQVSRNDCNSWQQESCYSKLKLCSKYLLDINTLIDNTDYLVAFLKKYPNVESVRSIFNISLFSRKKTDFYRVFCRKSKFIGAVMRKQNYQHRLSVEMAHAHYDGWYMVFDTLTVRDDCYNQAFALGSTVIRDYVRKISLHIGIDQYGSARACPKFSDFHRYFCVVERGSKTGRLHYHCLHFFKHIPSNWKIDINSRFSVPKNRQITAMKQNFWKYGFTNPIAVRYSHNDAWGKLGWQYPYSLKGNRYVADVERSPLAVANYISKYITKLFNELTFEKGHHKWRIKLTRNLGMQMIDKLIQIPKARHLILTGSLNQSLRLIYQNRLSLPTNSLFKLRMLKSCREDLDICNLFRHLTNERFKIPNLFRKLDETYKLKTKTHTSLPPPTKCELMSLKVLDYEPFIARSNARIDELNNSLVDKILSDSSFNGVCDMYIFSNYAFNSYRNI